MRSERVKPGKWMVVRLYGHTTPIEEMVMMEIYRGEWWLTHYEDNPTITEPATVSSRLDCVRFEIQ